MEEHFEQNQDEAKEIQLLFKELGDLVDSALRKMKKYKDAQINGRIIAAVLAVATGDFLFGLLTYPLASSFFRKQLTPKENTGRIKHQLHNALKRRIFILLHFPEIILNVETKERIFRDILLYYMFQKRDWKSLEEMYTIGNNLDLNLCLEKMKKYIKSGGIKLIDDLIFFCLFYYEMTDHWLYRKLRNGREDQELQFAWMLGRMDQLSDIFEEVEKFLIAQYAAVLELREPFTPEQVRQNYRRLMKACHPDRFPDATDEIKKQLEEKTRQLNEAYQFFRERLGF